MKVYKTINGYNHSAFGGNFRWTEYLPIDNGDGTYTPGKWTPEVDEVAVGSEGYHVFLANESIHWTHEKCFVAEGRGDVKFGGYGSQLIAFSSVRLIRPVERYNTKYLREFLLDLAGGALPKVEFFDESYNLYQQMLDKFNAGVYDYNPYDESNDRLLKFRTILSNIVGSQMMPAESLVLWATYPRAHEAILEACSLLSRLYPGSSVLVVNRFNDKVGIS